MGNSYELERIEHIDLKKTSGSLSILVKSLRFPEHFDLKALCT